MKRKLFVIALSAGIGSGFAVVQVAFQLRVGGGDAGGLGCIDHRAVTSGSGSSSTFQAVRKVLTRAGDK